MLNQLTFSNFRAFRSGSIDIRPITILMGTNGSGKTSILNLLMMLAQTASTKGFLGSPGLRVNGPLCSVGAVENVFHRKKGSTITVGLGYNRGVMEAILDEIRTSLSNELLATAERLFFYLGGLKIRDNKYSDLLKKADAILFRKHRSQNGDIFLDELKEFYIVLREALNKTNASLPEELISPSDHQWLARRSGPPTTRQLLFRQDIAPRDVRACVDLYRSLRDLQDNHSYVRLVLRQDEKSKQLAVKEVAVSDGRSDFLALTFASRGSVSITSNYLPAELVNQYERVVHDSIKTDTNVFDMFSNHANAKNLFSAVILRFFHGFLFSAGQQFASGKMVHIGPLRAHPRRYYSPAASEIDADASMIIEGLRFDKELRDKVNDWFGVFNISIGLKDVEDFLSKIIILHREAVKIRRESDVRLAQSTELSNDEYYDLIDSGFGYSQVLPVIVRTLAASNDSIVLVEQPEIHLHPGMQSDLGDFFIDAVIDGSGHPNGKRVIIETHSEYLVKRLQRRIGTGKISSSLVSLNFVEADESGAASTVRREEIEPDGSFDWPERFFSTDIDDMFALFNAAAT